MLEEAFQAVYTKFKLRFYQKVMTNFQDREEFLTTVETFCAETIQTLGFPTVNEFASFVNISLPNAVYKINNLVHKGYVKKIRGENDKREVHLRVTQKYIEDYNISNHYVKTVMDRIRMRFPPEDIAKLEEMLQVISEELMSEVKIPAQPSDHLPV